MSLSRHRLSTIIFLGTLAGCGSLIAAPIRFLPWDEKIAARKIAFQHGKEVDELMELHPDLRSAPLGEARSEGPFQLVALDRKDSDGKPVTVEIKLPVGIQSPLVLILPDAKHPSGMRPFVTEDATASFSWGTMRFINATGKVLLVRHDQAVKALPDSWTPVDIDPGGEIRNMGVQLVARDDTKTLLYSAAWNHDPNIRNLIFVLPGSDVRTGVVDFKIVPEDRRILTSPAAVEPESSN